MKISEEDIKIAENVFVRLVAERYITDLNGADYVKFLHGVLKYKEHYSKPIEQEEIHKPKAKVVQMV